MRVGVIAGLIVSLLQMFPTGDGQGRMVAQHQPVTLAAMEALCETQPGAPLAFIGQPNVAEQKIDNPIVVPKMLSFLTWRSWNAEVKGLDQVSASRTGRTIFPCSITAYHIMVGLGTIFIAVIR